MNYPAKSGKIKNRTRENHSMQKHIEKCITQEAPYSFRVRMMSSGHKLDKTFNDLASARNFRDSHKLSQSLDVHESAIIESRLKKRAIKSLTVSDALDRYLKEVTPLKKGADVEKHRINKSKTTNFAKKPLHGVTPDDVLNFLEEIGSSENNKRKYASLISHLFKTAIRAWRLPVSNPVSGQIDLPSNGKPRERRLRNGEYDLLMSALEGQAKLFSIIAIETAMRRSEIAELRWEFINKSARTALLPDTKNNTQRTACFSLTAMQALEEIGFKKSGVVFNLTMPQLRSQFERARKEINADDLHFHDLRHEGTSRLFEKGLNIIEVQSMTGHKTLEELKKYTHLSPTLILSKLDK